MDAKDQATTFYTQSIVSHANDLNSTNMSLFSSKFPSPSIMTSTPIPKASPTMPSCKTTPIRSEKPKDLKANKKIVEEKPKPSQNPKNLVPKKKMDSDFTSVNNKSKNIVSANNLQVFFFLFDCCKNIYFLKHTGSKRSYGTFPSTLFFFFCPTEAKACGPSNSIAYGSGNPPVRDRRNSHLWAHGFSRFTRTIKVWPTRRFPNGDSRGWPTEVWGAFSLFDVSFIFLSLFQFPGNSFKIFIYF